MLVWVLLNFAETFILPTPNQLSNSVIK